MTTDIAALKRLMRSKPNKTYVTDKQVHCIVRLFESYDPEMTREKRIALLRFLVGDIMWDNYRVEVNSTKNLTCDIGIVLIEQLAEKDPTNGKLRLSSEGRILIERLESDFEEYIASGADRASATRISSGVSAVQEPAVSISTH